MEANREINGALLITKEKACYTEAHLRLMFAVGGGQNEAMFASYKQEYKAKTSTIAAIFCHNQITSQQKLSHAWMP